MKNTSLSNQFEATSRSCKIPTATYRLQFNREFTFHNAADIAEYLSLMGFSDVYASPIFQARLASTHGYDICDYNQFNSALGSDRDFDHFAATLKTQNLGLILDMVPNHMGIGEQANRWWMNVLEQGPHSQYAPFFDIRWGKARGSRDERIVLPILGDHYGKVLENSEFQIRFEQGSLFLEYYQTRLPLAPSSYRIVLKHLLTVLGASADEVTQNPLLALLNSGFDRYAVKVAAPGSHSTQPQLFSDFKESLAEHCISNPAIQEALEETLAAINGVKGTPRSFDRLDALLRKQHYRLAFWRSGLQEINYRRFFDISDLAAVRMEESEVFEASHQLIQRLLFEGRINGLRIDHPDGLWDPAQYFHRLQACFLIQSQKRFNTATAAKPEPRPAASDPLCELGATGEAGGSNWPLYVVAEKILSDGEDLPKDWPIHGTTGYETLNLINGLFVRKESEKDFNRIYAQFIGKSPDYHGQVLENKRRILETSLSSELNALASQLKEFASGTRSGCDFTLGQLQSCLTNVLATFPVYRTYVTEKSRTVSEEDRVFIERAITDAKKLGDPNTSAPLTFLEDTLLLRRLAPHSKVIRRQQILFIMRFQQLAGPAMAKGLEDTTFYRYNRLVSLNEVGGHPNHFGISLADFHAGNARRQLTWPDSLTATATHDTKRGEDHRARINVLSEIPNEWEQALDRWRAFNSPNKRIVRGTPAPDANDEYLFYQTLIGAWPATANEAENLELLKERFTEYMLKAAKEAKVHTSWIDSDREYENALREFIAGVLDRRPDNPFLADFKSFQSRVAFFGALNSLAQTLLKITVPGIPDFYQGTELWDLSLVDPDNRRPVDYGVRNRMLKEIETQHTATASKHQIFVVKLLKEWRTGQVKQYVIHTALALRNRCNTLFETGHYRELTVTGPLSDRVCAFARTNDAQAVIVVVPRLAAGLVHGKEVFPTGSDVWRDTRIVLPKEIPVTPLQNVLTSETVQPVSNSGATTLCLGDALRTFPIALFSCPENSCAPK